MNQFVTQDQQPKSGLTSQLRTEAQLVEAHVVGRQLPRASAVGALQHCDAQSLELVEGAIHPTELLATIYHSVGIKPDTIVYNHLNQPRELVKGEVVSGLLS